MRHLLYCLLLSIFGATSASAALVSDKTIATQKKLTHQFSLKNGIAVTYREIPNSEILTLSVVFHNGLKDVAPGQKALHKWLWSTLPMASKSFPKENVFQMTERYSLEMGCSGGIEYSTCGLGTVNENWQESIKLFSDLIKNPALTKEDVALNKDRIIASLKNVPSDPGSYVNEVANRIFYPVNHPYRHNHDEALKELEKLNGADLKKFHARVLNASAMEIVIVGSMPMDAMKKDLNTAFGAIKKGPKSSTAVAPPKFDPKNAFSFEDRPIPTAYIRAKIVTPPAQAKDAVAVKLMFEILSEELGDEIRTKRSLSYSVFSYVIQYSMGIGVVGASTSKPKETLEAMQVVIDRLKTKTYSKEEIQEYKNIFTTNYYLTQETNSSLAGAITSSRIFHNGTDNLYEMPKELAKVTGADVKKQANALLKNFRVGVIFDRKNFKDEWAQALIKKYASK